MSVFRIFNFSTERALSCRNFLFSRSFVKCEQQHASVSVKTYEKFGIPSPPKKPMTPYLRYLQTIFRPKITEEQPELMFKEVIKLGAQEWSKCDPELKKDLQKEYLKDMETYLVKLEEYKKVITPEQQNLLKNIRMKKKKAKESARMAEKKESLGKPKKPPTGFIRFVMDKKNLKTEDVLQKNWMKTLSEKWRDLPDQEKEKYLQEAKVEMEKFKIELVAWEEKMLREGHIDVVRNKELVESTKRKSSKTPV